MAFKNIKGNVRGSNFLGFNVSGKGVQYHTSEFNKPETIVYFNASGGSVNVVNQTTYFVFRGLGDFNFTSADPSITSVDILAIAGGGGPGPYYYTGGGGAGGLVYVTDFPISLIPVGPNTVTVGAGGANLASGDDTTIFGLTAKGGGQGGGPGSAAPSGGSGGGGSMYTPSAAGSATQPGTPQTYGDGTLVYNAGYPGGAGANYPPGQTSGGGGGGAGSSGAPEASGAHGGKGILFPEYTSTQHPNLPSTGGFAGGGGGGSYTISQAIYGGFNPGGPADEDYGAGNGGYPSQPWGNDVSGRENTGGGAGGVYSPNPLVNGGSGIVVIRVIGANRGSIPGPGS
jgi:hypothetical protein